METNPREEVTKPKWPWRIMLLKYVAACLGYRASVIGQIRHMDGIETPTGLACAEHTSGLQLTAIAIVTSLAEAGLWNIHLAAMPPSDEVPMSPPSPVGQPVVH